MIKVLKKALIFLRRSAEDDEEVLPSLRAQEQACRELAEEAGYSVDPELVYRERGSGRDLGRSELEKLMQAAKDRPMESVVVYDYDRLSWDPSQLMKTLRELHRLGVVVWAAS